MIKKKSMNKHGIWGPIKTRSAQSYEALFFFPFFFVFISLWIEISNQIKIQLEYVIL